MKIKRMLGDKNRSQNSWHLGSVLLRKIGELGKILGGISPGIVAILLNLADQPETRLTEVRARKNDDSTEFRIYHTTLCSYHTTP